jgi:hypothetical protein
VESDPQSQPVPLDYGGAADRHASARRARYRKWSIIGAFGALGMLAFYAAVVAFARERWEGELPYAVVIAGAGMLPAVFMLAGCVGTWFPAPWARLAILIGGYGVVGGSIVQMMAYLAAVSLFGEFAAWGAGVVVAQLAWASGFLYTFHDEEAMEFFGG